MKRIFLIIFVLIFIFSNLMLPFISSGKNLIKGEGSYGWVNLNNGLYGGDVYCISIDSKDGNRMYVGTANGVYRSMDGGLTWESTVLTNHLVYSIQIDPTDTKVIYAGADDGIYLGVNYGEDWLNIGESTGGINSIALDPINPMNIYAGLCGGIYLKRGTAQWANISSNLSNRCIETISINPNNPNIIFVGTMNTVDYDGWKWGGMFMTKNDGVSWSQVGINTIRRSVDSIIFDPKNPNVVYAGTEQGVFKSIDGGLIFSEINNGLQVDVANTIVNSLAIDPNNSKNIYAGTEKGIFKSENGGLNWVSKNFNLPNTCIKSLAVSPSNPEIIYAGTDGSGIFKSLDNGESWVPANNGLDAVMIESLGIDSSYNSKNIYAGTNGNGLFKSTDGGQNWFSINNGLTLGGDNSDWYPLVIRSIVKDYKDSQTIYLGTSKGIFKSTNGGETWVQKNSGLTTKYVESVLIDPSDNRIIYVGTDDFLFKSTDSGESWKHLDSGIQAQSGGNTIVHSITVDSRNTQIIYIGTDKGIFKSANGGASWSQMNLGLSNKLVYSIAINPLDSSILYAGTSDSLFKSTNGGNSWKQLSNPALDLGFSEAFVNSILIDLEDTKVIYIGTNHGVFQSRDGGDTWSTFGLEYLVVNSLALSKGPYNIYAGTGNNGVYTYLPIDIEAPKLKILSPSDNSKVYNKKVELKGIITDNVGVTSLFIGSNKVDFAPDGTFTAEVELSEGSNTIKLTAYDAAGNRGELIIYFTYLKDTTIPNLQIFYPFNNSTVDTEVIVVKGAVSDEESGLESITVNGNATSVKSDGSFAATLNLVEGINTINVIATDKAVNKTTMTLNITYRKPVSKITLILQIGISSFTVNGETRYLDSSPVIKNGRTLVPTRAIVEALGGTIEWIDETKTVIIELGSNSIRLQIGNANALVNGENKLIDTQNLKVVPEIINGRTMLPLRFVTEQLGATVNWNGTTKTITITYIK